MDLQESGGKNCQVVGADHNLKLDPNGLFKVAAPVWIFRDLCTALERGQRQRRQRECISARRFGRTPARTQTEQSVRKMQSEAASFHIFDDSGRREWRLIMLHWVLPPDGGPQEVRHLPRRLFPPWPGNYPNLPSSCDAAPVQRRLGPPLWLHYQRWSSLMARLPQTAQAAAAGGVELAGRRWWLRRSTRRRKT